MSDPSEVISITKETRVQLVLVLAIVTGIVGALAWAQSMKSDQVAQAHAYELSQQEMRGELRQVKTSIDSLRDLVESTSSLANDSLLKKAQHEDWASRLQLLNPSIVVPDPKNDNHPYDLSHLAIQVPR